MGHWLAPPGSAKQLGTMKRFEARYWTVNFPRPMMASVVTAGPNALRADAVFYRADDLAGLIWEAEDRHDHPLLRYETNRDFRGCKLSFHWRSAGLKPLDAVDGPTLTIEGRDAEGQPRGWYVRLWNYASGTSEDADISLDFDHLDGGFLLPGEADPVWAGDIDRMFISLVPPGYTRAPVALAAPVEAWVEISGIACDGPGSVLSAGETMVPEHKLRIASGYDDSYHLTPERLLRNALWLGYRGLINHYVGMSHYFRLESGLKAGSSAGALNSPCAAWHRDFLIRAKALGFEVILSLSYELIDLHCPDAWKQRTAEGEPGLTGWDPPSALLSPANGEAMAYLRSVARALASIAADAGQRVRFQVGEPWWWVTAGGRICLYDDAARWAFDPVAIADVSGPLDSAQRATLDLAGSVLAASTAALCDAVRQEAPGAETLLLAYLPSLLGTPDLLRANLPGAWSSPTFDVLQLEDYEWVTSGNFGASERGVAQAGSRLAYTPEKQHYFAGFVPNAQDQPLWQEIAEAVQAARRRGTAEIFLWALPQVLRDGFVWFDEEEEPMEAFDDVRFPVALGREASVEPAFSTAVVTTANGMEQRNSDWSDARLRFDAGPGVRGNEELQELIAFFRARRGAAVGFRFQDPFDHSSNEMTGDPGPEDQLLGVGDGARTEFPLLKHYGEQLRRIIRPVGGTVRVSVAGVEKLGGWSLRPAGIVSFEQAPAAGAEVRSGFLFDVPVRFAEDRLTFSRATFEAGEIASVPLIEIREAA